MDGANASTTFTDSSSLTTAVTPQSGAQISTAQSKFGGASGVFNGSSDFLTFTDTANYQVLAGDFTVDFWFQTTTLNNGATQSFFGDLDSGGTNTSIQIDFDHVNSPDSIRATLNFTDASGIEVVYGSTLLANVWNHCAVVRSGANVDLYANGIKGSSTGNAAAKIVKSNQNGGSWSIAKQGAFGLFFNGWIDEFRFSKGIARWTSNFTPPSGPYST